MPILQFLEKALPTVGTIAGGILGGAADVASLGALAPVINPVTGAAAGGALGKVGENALTHQGLGAGVVQSAIGGAVGQGVGGLASGLIGDTLGSGLAGAFTKGATIGGTSSAAATAAMGDRSGKDLTMSFLQGAAFGGVTGGAVQSVSKRFFSPDKLQKMATSENTSQIEKDVTPVTGPVVAQKIAPAIAKSNDPEIVSNIIDSGVKEHLPSPAPQTPIQDVTPVAQVPETAGQGTFGAKAYSNTFGVPKEQAAKDIQDIQNKEALQPSPSLPNPESLGRNAQNNPLLGKVDIPQVEKGDFGQAHLNADMVLQHEQTVGKEALDSFNQLSPRDQELMKAIETNPVEKVAKQADNPQAFKDAESSIRNYYDLRHAYDTRLGIKTGYRQNYLRQILESKPIDEGVYNATGGNVTPGYTLERLNDTLNTDVGAALERDIRSASFNHAKLAYKEGLMQAYPEGGISTGEEPLMGDEFGTSQQLKTPYGNDLFASKPIANQINKRGTPAPTTGLLDKYDVVNAFAKNTKLAGGGFHSVNVLGSYGGQQLISLLRGDISPLRAASDLNSVIKSTFSKDYFDQKLADFQSRGRDLDFSASGLVTDMKRVGADIDVRGGLGNLPVLKQIHDSIFGRQIPMLKMLQADQKFDALKLDRNNPADLAKMKQISLETNQNYGGFNRQVQGISPETFKKAARVVLATDYNEGQIRSLVDAISKGGEAGKLAREVVFGKALLFGGIAAGVGYAGGEFQGKNPQQIALDILQKTANPSATFGNYKVGLPTTQVSELGKPISETVSNALSGKTVKTPWENFASARLAAIPSFAEQNISNKNFYGQPIHGTDFYGRPVSPGQTLANEFGSLSPIPVTQAIQAEEGNQTPASVAANIAGLRVAPNNSIQYAPIYGQTYLAALQKTPGIPKDQIAADQQFFAALGSAGGKKRAETQAAKDLAAGNDQKAQQDIAAYNVKLLKALKPWSQSDGAKYFDQTMQSILQSSLIKMSTIRNNINYAKKTNPTSIGLPINALQGGQ